MPGDKNYIVEKKEEIRRITRAGEPFTVYRIWATSDGGTYFHIEIPEADLEQSHKLLSLKAKTLDSI
jgi:hypothetical protein